ncbi:MAG TPA: sll0787 family AIR synthase-like protein [Chthoniobacterales bacterium]
MADHETLLRLAAFLRSNAAIADKVSIAQAYAPAQLLAGAARVGDDCAAIPDGDGFLLFAAEGMLESFVAADPWFAGYSAVMVNLSDVASMGGRPMAVVDVLWSSDTEISGEIWKGMSAASRAYNVPIVGGHTTRTKSGSTFLAAAVLGKASNLITSFDAQPGDDLLMAVDLRGSFRGDKPFWNASVNAPPERLWGDLALLPELAENGWCLAGKDISNGGIVGTLAMLLECSGVGAELWLDRLPQPAGVEREKWLISFPSYGYLLSVKPEFSKHVTALFHERDIACAAVGKITGSPSLTLVYGKSRLEFASADCGGHWRPSWIRDHFKDV